MAGVEVHSSFHERSSNYCSSQERCSHCSRPCRDPCTQDTRENPVSGKSLCVLRYYDHYMVKWTLTLGFIASTIVLCTVQNHIEWTLTNQHGPFGLVGLVNATATVCVNVDLGPLFLDYILELMLDYRKHSYM